MTKSQLTTLRKLAEAAKDAEFMTIAMQPAAILELIGTLERAVEVIRFYGNRVNWIEAYESDVQDVITFSDLGCKSYNEDSDFACSSGGRRAREFLASLEGKKI